MSKPLSEVFACRIPEGKLGVASIEKFTVDYSTSRMGIFWQHIPEGDYTRLLIRGGLMMSDTPKEFRDHLAFFREAKGDVLIHGLGLGCALSVVLNNPQVGSVTVVEIEPDLIQLVSPHFPGVEIIQADSLEWMPPKGKRWDCVWHDIWPAICTDNLPEMKKLHRRYGRKCGWQASWSRGECERHARWEALTG